MAIETVKLGEAGRQTTRLGFGCSVTDRSGMRLLDAAFDAGIRHFDVARSYGHGLSESFLGKFVKRRGSEITVTTKYGVLPPIRGSISALIRRIAKPLVKPLRRFKSVDQGVERTLSGMYNKADFSVADARASLEKSLRELKMDRVDVFLMHDPVASDLHEPLLEFLTESVRSGRIGTFGVASNHSAASDIFRHHRAFCPVVQTNWSLLSNKSTAFPGSVRIHYRTIWKTYAHLRSVLDDNPHLLKKWSYDIGVDLNDASMLSGLCLQGPLTAFPESIVLFSTKDPNRILANVRAAEDARLATASLRMIELLRHEMPRSNLQTD